MKRYFLILAALQIFISSCERVIEIDLNSASPSIVAEAQLFKDSVILVSLSYTNDYFSSAPTKIIDDATISLYDDTVTEELLYTGNGKYRGRLIKGSPEGKYNITINHSGSVYNASSEMPAPVSIVSSQYHVSFASGIMNPEGKRVVTVTCGFLDDPSVENFYMICFTANGKLIEDRYFMISENSSNGGSFTRDNSLISFSESMFYDGYEVEVMLYSMDESVYNYFYQLDDILFWKRRVIPPVPYNPASNFNNGMLGFFAAWTSDSKKIIIDE